MLTSRVFAAVAGLGLAMAGLFSIRLAWADTRFRTGTIEGVARAIEILPDKPEYLLFHALQLDYAGQDSMMLLERAARLSPHSSAARIRLGLRAESRGDTDAAERWLLNAVRVDRQFEPRWTLANFYFREERHDDFWKTMREALNDSYGDRRAAFDLCWRATDRASVVLERAIPHNRALEAAYLAYVLSNHPDAVIPVALRLASFHDASDLPVLESATDAAIQYGKAQSARDLWRETGHADPLEKVTDADLRQFSDGHGFDWRWHFPEGVGHQEFEDPPAHRIQLSGKQPETCDLLSETLLLVAGKRYELSWESRSRSARPTFGFSWKIGDTEAVLSPSEEWKGLTIPFTAASDLVHLTVRYQRPLGEPRWEGNVDIRGVSVRPSR